MRLQHAARIILSLVAVVYGNSAQAQYCPQSLCGQMNGTNYYYCQMCADKMHCTYTYVCTDSSFNTGGCCGGCNCGGVACVDPIPSGYGPKVMQGANVNPKEDATQEKAASDPEVQPVYLNTKTPQPELITYNNSKRNHRFAVPHPSIHVREVRLVLNVTGRPVFFRCVEAVNDLHPEAVSLRIGQQLADGETPPTGTPTKMSERVSGGGYFHRLHILDAADDRYFDVISFDKIN